MTKLPPGFIHEVPQHLSQPDVPVDDRTGVPFVDLENYCCGEFSVTRSSLCPRLDGMHIHIVLQEHMGFPL